MTKPPATATESFAELERLRSEIDRDLSVMIAAEEPADLMDPARYVLQGGGKRLRPILVHLAAGTCGTALRSPDTRHAALAVELFHNFTLVHDDIMDHAQDRRGRITVHERWSEDVAILVGDYLFGLSYDHLACLSPDVLPEILRRFGRMVRELCEGQSLDKTLETAESVTESDYLHMIDRKTGALLRCCFELGALVARADTDVVDTLGAAGQNLGRAFQVQDDLLDLTASSEKWGKRIGGDLIEGKKTLLLLRGLAAEDGDHAEWFRRIVSNGGLEPDLVPEARQRLAALGVLDRTRTDVQRYSAQTRDVISRFSDSVSRNVLLDLIDRLVGRTH